MAEQQEYGKIQDVTVGRGGGGPDTLFGVSFRLGGKGWGCGAWKRMDTDEFGPWLKDMLLAAKVNNIPDLAGKPIVAHFEDGLLRQWRILEEVL